jgi:hypothetical protein
MATEALVLSSFCYMVVPQVLLALRARSDDFKDLAILVMRYELAVLRRLSNFHSTVETDSRNAGRSCGIQLAKTVRAQ